MHNFAFLDVFIHIICGQPIMNYPDYDLSFLGDINNITMSIIPVTKWNVLDRNGCWEEFYNGCNNDIINKVFLIFMK